MTNQEVREELLINEMSIHELADLMDMSYTNLNTKLRSEMSLAEKNRLIDIIRTRKPVEKPMGALEMFAKDWNEVTQALKPRFGVKYELEVE